MFLNMFVVMLIAHFWLHGFLDWNGTTQSVCLTLSVWYWFRLAAALKSETQSRIHDYTFGVGLCPRRAVLLPEPLDESQIRFGSRITFWQFLREIERFESFHW